jgi:hypothetical protein
LRLTSATRADIGVIAEPTRHQVGTRAGVAAVVIAECALVAAALFVLIADLIVYRRDQQRWRRQLTTTLMTVIGLGQPVDPSGVAIESRELSYPV